uniref:Uncharacterized protein n=1 Tax=Anguilla anguilla TaxID=7936 RepID=A0A0E9R9X5_ANGAN
MFCTEYSCSPYVSVLYVQ